MVYQIYINYVIVLPGCRSAPFRNYSLAQGHRSLVARLFAKRYISAHCVHLSNSRLWFCHKQLSNGKSASPKILLSNGWQERKRPSESSSLVIRLD